jgi:hypothetical protein
MREHWLLVKSTLELFAAKKFPNASSSYRFPFMDLVIMEFRRE